MLFNNVVEYSRQITHVITPERYPVASTLSSTAQVYEDRTEAVLLQHSCGFQFVDTAAKKAVQHQHRCAIA